MFSITKMIKKKKKNKIYIKYLIINTFFIFYYFDFFKKKNFSLQLPLPSELEKKPQHSVHTPISNKEYGELKNEQEMPHLKEINKKRVFEKRFPLPKKINCNPHFRSKELLAFLSFLTNNNTFFETGSGCSSIIAKYYTKKSYAIEGCKKWFEEGIKNGLKDNIIFKDLKPDNPIWSYPGSRTTLKDWKNYFQSYKEEYNADVILIDGRFKVATAMDIFNKIRNDTIVLIHEYSPRPLYFIIEKYYQYVYHWDTLVAFVKKKDIQEIPLEVQKNYWNNPL